MLVVVVWCLWVGARLVAPYYYCCLLAKTRGGGEMVRVWWRMCCERWIGGGKGDVDVDTRLGPFCCMLAADRFEVSRDEVLCFF
jgi:hypothetical protein